MVKYQVFISSTYNDLQREREQVIKATLEMGHIPVGMEMFSAADEEQWKIITRQIDSCDYYAVILAHRYGSTVSGVSYTEKEYDYAISKGIPVLSFVLERDASWPADRIDTDPNAKLLIDNFIKKVKTKPVSFWASAADLHGKYSISLMKQIISTPRPGWARATDVAGPEVVKEIARLSSENAILRQELLEAKHTAEIDAAAERKKIHTIMKSNKVKMQFFYHDSKDWEDEATVSMYQLFYILAPELMIEQTTASIADLIGYIHRPNRDREPRSTYPIPVNVTNALISDFISLELFEPSTKKHSVNDQNKYWSITEKGREVYVEIRRERMENVVENLESGLADANAEDSV